MRPALDWRLCCPLASGYAMTRLCPMTPSHVPQAPSPRAFKVVWPLLYLLLGASWSAARDDAGCSRMHAFLTLLLCLWLFFFSCRDDPKMSLYVLSSVVATTVSCMCLHGDRTAKVLLTPLLGFVHLAFSLNFALV